jgi:hypothetical protein
MSTTQAPSGEALSGGGEGGFSMKKELGSHVQLGKDIRCPRRACVGKGWNVVLRG